MEHHDLKWWYWLGTGVPLALGLEGWAPGVPVAIGVTVLQAVHFARVTQDPFALTVQVRAVFVSVLAAGLYAPLSFLHRVAAIGLAANLVFDYCLAARILVLAPWNRVAPLSVDLVVWALVAPPSRRSMAERLAARERRAASRSPRGSEQPDEGGVGDRIGHGVRGVADRIGRGVSGIGPGAGGIARGAGRIARRAASHLWKPRGPEAW